MGSVLKICKNPFGETPCQKKGKNPLPYTGKTPFFEICAGNFLKENVITLGFG